MKTVTQKYFKLAVTMKHGFQYSVFCGVRQLEGMKKSAEGYWTDKIEVTETTEDEYRKWWRAGETEVPQKPPQKKIKETKKSYPQFSGLENFFENGSGNEDGRSNSNERPSVPPQKKIRDKKADTPQKVSTGRKSRQAK